MCILFAHSGGPSVGGYKLILASNRDEYFKRPADSAAPWKEDDSVIGGRDMEKGREGGTWLAASPSRRRVGALLNLPGVPGPEIPRGRGSVVSDFVLGDKTTEEYLTYFKEFGHQFSPFNFVTVHILENSSKIQFYSNYDAQLRDYEGAVSFSNSQADKPLQKTVVGLEEFEKIIAKNFTDGKSKDNLVQELLKLLKSEKRHLPDPELEKRKPKAPEALAAIFVKIPEVDYGTRTHTIILVDKDDNFEFWEWTKIPEQKEWKMTHLQQKI